MNGEQDQQPDEYPLQPGVRLEAIPDPPKNRMTNENLYDLAVLVSAVIIIVTALLLVALAGLPADIALAVIGIGGGAYAVRSGRAKPD